MRALAAFPGLILSLTLAVGCGRPNVNEGVLTGVVNYQGQPLRGGVILLESQTPQGPSVATLDIRGDGTFKASDLPPGLAKVSVNTDFLKPTPGEVPNAPPPPSALPLKKYTPIPAKYRSFATSELTVEIVPGAKTLTIDLK